MCFPPSLIEYSTLGILYILEDTIEKNNIHFTLKSENEIHCETYADLNVYINKTLQQQQIFDMPCFLLVRR